MLAHNLTRTAHPTTRSLIPTPPAAGSVSPSLRKSHRYDEEATSSSGSDYSTDSDDDEVEPAPPQKAGQASSIRLSIQELGRDRVYYWNEDRKGTGSDSPSTTPTTTKSTADPDPTGAHASPTLAITTRLVTITPSLKPSSSSNDYESPPFSPTDDDSEPSRTNNDSNPKPTGTGSNDKPTSSGGSPPSATSTGTAPDASSSIVPQDLLDVLLKTHNDFRVLHQVDPLGWNDTLAESSDRWVDNCVWEHSGGKLLEGGYGENLFGSSGTKSAEDTPVDGKAGVDAWNDEIKMYTYSPPTGFTHETGQ
ncbi:hypothetical protein JCM16303_006536 [Sporobolomyces ruberrimus]